MFRIAPFVLWLGFSTDAVLGFQREYDAYGIPVPRKPISNSANPLPPLLLPSDANQLNVLDFGANGSICPASSTNFDNTAAFQAALDSAGISNSSGKTVFVPAGCYAFKGSLKMPPGVVLKGSFATVPSHDLRGKGSGVNDGTVLSPTAGRATNDPNSDPFITAGENAGISGLVIYYTEQEKTNTPVAYPWTLLLNGNNAFVTDVELLGAWNGINATRAHRHYIARVQGHPLNIGVFVDSTYDIGRIEDVHFNPWFSCEHPFIEYQLIHGRAFVLGRSDWEYVFNTFAFGYAVGYHFIQTPTGNMNGNFLGIGMDLATNASVLVEASQPAGLLITNGEFTAFTTTDWLPASKTKGLFESSQVVVETTNTGPVKFVDTSFWGPTSQVALLKGQGVVSFSSCEFVQWDLQSADGRAAIRVLNGSIILQANHFGQAGHHGNSSQVMMSATVQKGLLLGNMLDGKKRDNSIVIEGAGSDSQVQMYANIWDN